VATESNQVIKEVTEKGEKKETEITAIKINTVPF